MTYAVILRLSPTMAAAHVLRDDEVLQGGDAVRFRLCQTDDAEKAERAAALLRERILTGERR